MVYMSVSELGLGYELGLDLEDPLGLVDMLDLEFETAVVSATDLFLFDYKETDPERHLRTTGYAHARVIDNLRYLDAQGAAIVLRCPIIPGANLRDDHLEGIADLAHSLQHLQEVHVMGYHPLGQSKRQRLGADATATYRAPSRDELKQVAQWLRAHGIEHVNID